MRGRTHLYAGWAAGMAVSLASGAGLATAAVLSTVAAGAALVPDIDHPESTASTSFGRVGRAVSHAVGHSSRLAYQATGGRTIVRPDRPVHDGSHRGITHTLFAAWIAAGLVALVIPDTGTAAMVGTAVLLAGSGRMLHRASGRAGWAVPAWLIAVGIVSDPSAGLSGAAPLLPYAVAVGWLSHLLLDAGTPHGVPLVGPLFAPVGLTWWYARLPWTTPCGSATEERIVQPALAVVALLTTIYAIWSTL